MIELGQLSNIDFSTLYMHIANNPAGVIGQIEKFSHLNNLQTKPKPSSPTPPCLPLQLQNLLYGPRVPQHVCGAGPVHHLPGYWARGGAAHSGCLCLDQWPHSVLHSDSQLQSSRRGGCCPWSMVSGQCLVGWCAALLPQVSLDTYYWVMTDHHIQSWAQHWAGHEHPLGPAGAQHQGSVATICVCGADWLAGKLTTQDLSGETFSLLPLPQGALSMMYTVLRYIN